MLSEPEAADPSAGDTFALNAARAALPTHEETLRLVLENAREFAIFSTDADMLVTTWNTGAERLLGYSEAEILGQSGRLIFTPEDRAMGGPEQEVAQALATGRATDERWHLRKDGSRFWGSGILTLMYDENRRARGFVKILRDLTEEHLRQAERERSHAALQAALRDAEAANRAKDDFLAVLSHELRTPLTPVLLMTHVLSRRTDLPGDVQEALAIMERNVQTETRLIDDLLELTRLARSPLVVTRAPTDLHDAVRRAVEDCAEDLQEKAQRLDLALDAPASHLDGDPARLRQMFFKLLQNASKFTPEGGAIHVRSRQDAPDRIIVEVIDTGIGIDPAALARVFDPFEQADESVARQFGGLGLGLAISRAIAEAHGGTLDACSAGAGQGTVFTAILPLSGQTKSIG